MAIDLCWMCGKLAKTAEHRIKKTDLVKRYGSGPYQGDNQLFHIRGEQAKNLQGPNSKLIKYDNNLCASCNNHVSQPFDKAYELFIDWVVSNEANVIKKRVIDFEEVFGANWAKAQVDLFKYFAKCFGCRMHEAGRKVPRDVVKLLCKNVFSTGLCVTFAVNEAQVALDAGMQHIGTEALISHTKKGTGKEVSFYTGSFFRWLTVMYWYNHYPLEPVGGRWIANAKILYLGWHHGPITAEITGLGSHEASGIRRYQ